VLERSEDRDSRSNPRLLTVRSTLSSHLENLAESVEKNRAIEPTAAESLDEPPRFQDPEEAEYRSTMASRYKDIESILETSISTVPSPSYQILSHEFRDCLLEEPRAPQFPLPSGANRNLPDKLSS
jgi:hypothetical protein